MNTNIELLKQSIKTGDYNILVKCIEDGCICDKWCLNLAAEYGNIMFLKYLHESLVKCRILCPWDSTTCEKASGNGNLDCLIYLHENGCPLDKWSSRMAASNGYLECLMYCKDNGCILNEGDAQWASENGHLNCLIYLHENGCPWDRYTCHYTAIKKQWACLKYAYENGCPCDEKDIEILKTIYR